MRPHNCVLLAIDPAATSGYAVFAPAGPIESGTAKTIADLESVVALAQREAEAHELPLIVVGEEWVGVGKLTAKTVAGMGAAWGRWAAVLEQAEHPKRRTLRLSTGTWRKRAYGKSRGKTEAFKAWAMAYVAARFRVRLKSDDEAEAVVIGDVAMRSPEVAAVLPGRKS